MMNSTPTTFTVPAAGKYYIKLHCGAAASLTPYSFKLTGNTVAAKEPPKKTNAIPNAFALEKNYPNPFVSNTTIAYQLPENNTVRIKVFDIAGREVRELVRGYKTAGRYQVVFHAGNLPGGIYFYEIKAGSFFEKRKMSLVK
jgi:hypothetical protein